MQNFQKMYSEQQCAKNDPLHQFAKKIREKQLTKLGKISRTTVANLQIEKKIKKNQGIGDLNFDFLCFSYLRQVFLTSTTLRE